MRMIKSDHKKVRLRNEKMIRKIDEESLQLYRFVKKATEKLVNRISNFEELESEKSLNLNR